VPDLTNSEEIRKRYLKDWLAPWNRGVGQVFPDCAVARVLRETSSICPAALAMDDMKMSVFGSWRSVAGSKNEELKQFFLPTMRTHMVNVAGDLIYQPLWLMMSITANAGLYNPMMGYAGLASMWHQVPPLMEAYIMHELSCMLDDVKHVKLGKVVDRRLGTPAYNYKPLSCLTIVVNRARHGY
jgi:hypothetical protein